METRCRASLELRYQGSELADMLQLQWWLLRKPSSINGPFSKRLEVPVSVALSPPWSSYIRIALLNCPSTNWLSYIQAFKHSLIGSHPTKPPRPDFPEPIVPRNMAFSKITAILSLAAAVVYGLPTEGYAY